MTKKKRSTIFKDSLHIFAIIIFLLVCAAGAYYSVKKFYDSLNSSLSKMNEEPVATITFKHKTAQRKFEDRMIWDRLAQHSPVYNGDTIRTAPESEATIFFVDGNIMDLSENTMAQIFLHEGKMQASIEEGQVVVNSSGAKEGAVVMFGESKILVKPGASVDASVVKDAGAQIKVMQGEAAVTGESGVEKPLEAGSALALNEKNEEQIIPLITVRSPRPNEKLLNFKGGEFSVPFKWDTRNLSEDEYLVLEISGSRKFTDIIKAEELKDITEKTVTLPGGIYYWRIYPSKAGENYSAQSRINILELLPPSLIVPEDKKEYSYKSVTPDVRFSWTQNDWVTAFDFEIADNEKMSSPVVKQRVTTPSSIVSFLKEGTWFWRVTPYYPINGTGLSEPSEVRSFSIKKLRSLEAVSLVSPAAGETVNTIQKDLLQFLWKDNPEVKEYEIKIGTDSTLSSPKIKQRVNTNSLSIKISEQGMKTGTWYWSVTQFDPKTGASQQSETREFKTAQIAFEQKLLYPPENFSVMQEQFPSVRFSWKTNIKGDSLFQIARDRNFEDIVLSRTANGQSYQGLSLGGGTYYWRIAAKENSSEYSAPARMLYVIAPLSVPVLKNPAENKKITVTRGSTVLFEWDSVPGADSYIFKVFPAAVPDNILMSYKLKENKFSADFSKYDNGTYTWSVQAERDEAASVSHELSEISYRNFEIRQFRQLSLVYPENGTVFDGMEALTKPGVVRWYSEQQTKNAVFTISRNKNGYSSPLYTVKNPGREIKLPPLEAGTYYWTVRAKNISGADVSPKQAGSFVVKKLLPLKLARIFAPEEGQMFAMDQALKLRTIDFSWSAVQDATDYLFTIKAPDGNTVVSRTLTDTRYHLEDFTNLENGAYTWSVRARTVYKGKTIRSSELSARTFVIDLPVVEDIILNDTGILYGM